MSDDTLRALVPPVLRPLLSEFFDHPRMVESKATCNDCAMCKKPDQPEVKGLEFFQPDLKCCTYYPHLPNFLVGAILEDTKAAEGRRRVRAKIEERYGVTPHFLAPPRRYSVLHNAARAMTYGRSKILLCPYFGDDAKCTIWENRTGVCSTFFCKHERGGAARRFWLALEHWLTYVEGTVAAWAASQVDDTVVEPNFAHGTMTLDDLEERPPRDSDYKSWWKKWVGREEEFYRACHARVKKLTRATLADVLKSDKATELMTELETRWRTVTQPTLAKRLVLNKSVSVQTLDSGVAVSAYSPLDVQFFEEGLYEVVKEMRADETVDEFRARMMKEHEVEIAPELLLYLQLFEVLVPPDEGGKKADATRPAPPEDAPVDAGVDAPFEPSSAAKEEAS
jgi:hypothetical protein